MPKKTHILIAALAAVILPAGAGAAKDPAASRARQLLLKQALDKHTPESLAATLSRNRKTLGELTPEQLRELRRRYYAFLKQDPARQVELIKAAEEFLKLSDRQKEEYRRRQEWLRKVVSSLTPKQRDQLKKLTPGERAQRLLELKAKLVGTQPAEKPATKPARTAPAK